MNHPAERSQPSLSFSEQMKGSSFSQSTQYILYNTFKWDSQYLNVKNTGEPLLFWIFSVEILMKTGGWFC
jgi:hypothetical protein